MRSLQALLNTGQPVVKVALSEVKGSSPREAGTEMFVSPTDVSGTIGGGQLEYMAIDEARALLRSEAETAVLPIPLGPEIGQCCGGRVTLFLSRLDAAAREKAVLDAEVRQARNPSIYVFGSGHVGRALAGVLASLPVRTILIDERQAELDLCDAKVEKCLTPLPEQIVAKAPPGSAFVVATHDHSLDFMIAAEALARGDAGYIGMIGSRTKRASFERWHARNIGGPEGLEKLTCPIGAGRSADKRPEIIALFAAAEIVAKLTNRDKAMDNPQDGLNRMEGKP